MSVRTNSERTKRVAEIGVTLSTYVSSAEADRLRRQADHDERTVSVVIRRELRAAQNARRYRTALEEIARETGTPYARIAQAALDGDQA